MSSPDPGPSRSIVYSSPFVPAEWIAAHGLRPARIRPSAAGAAESEGLCPFAGAFAATARRANPAAAVFAATCDQMRRAAELEAGDTPRFLFHVPVTWQTPAAHRLYRSELDRLGRFLEGLGGRAPATEDLAGRMERHETLRDRLLAQRMKMSSRAHAELTDRVYAGEADPFPDEAAERRGGEKTARPLMLLGAPLRAEDLELLDLIDRAGGRVTVDATEWGEREWPRRFDRRRLRADPAAELADAYFGHLPAVFRRPNSGLFEWLAREIARSAVRGIVCVTHSWCDLWRAELPRIRQAAAVPVLHMDLAGDRPAPGSWATRIHALLELSA